MQNMPMTDIIAMMKKQGINMDGFEAEAEDIWKSLDDMSAKDPDEYRKFIQNQYEESQEEDSKSSGTASSSSETKSATEERFFRPIAGFSMKTKTSGGDGIKIRGDGDGKVLYLNFCSHPAIEAPLDRNGRPADTKDSYRLVTMDGLQIPLVLGPLRDVDATTLAVDAVFNPGVIEGCVKCEDDSNNKGGWKDSVNGGRAMGVFKQQIIDLASDWVARDLGVSFSKSWSPMKDNYSGGRGNDKLTPVLFSVNHATEQSNNKQKVEADLKSGKNAVKSPVNFLSGGDVSTGSGTSTSSSSSSSKNPTAIQSPSSLLSALRNENRNNEESARDIIELSINPDKDKEKKRQQPVVSDVNNSTLSSTSTSSSSHRTDKTASGIKKGFLESSQMKDKSIYPESGSAEGTGGAKGGSLARVMDKCRVINMADMTSTGPSQSQSQSHSVNSNSKLSGSSNQSILVSEVKPLVQRILVDNMLLESTNCTYEDVILGGLSCLSVTVTGIDNAIFSLQSMDLQVSPDQILICLSVVDKNKNNAVKDTSNVRTLRLTGFSKQIMRDTATAKVSSKKKTLSITVQYCQPT